MCIWDGVCVSSTSLRRVSETLTLRTRRWQADTFANSCVSLYTILRIHTAKGHQIDIGGTVGGGRGLGRFRQDYLERRRSDAARGLQPHMDVFVDVARKLRMDDQLRWRLHSGHGLTESFPVAQTLTLPKDVLRSTSMETNCPGCGWLMSIDQISGPSLFGAQ